MAKMMDLEKLTEQTMIAIKQVTDDMELVQSYDADLRAVTILLVDVVIMQTVQASLTLAFLERWADGGD